MTILGLNSVNNMAFLSFKKFQNKEEQTENKSNSLNNIKDSLSNPTETIGRSQVNFKAKNTTLLSPKDLKSFLNAASKSDLNSKEINACRNAIIEILNSKNTKTLDELVINIKNDKKTLNNTLAEFNKRILIQLDSGNNKTYHNTRRIDKFIDFLGLAE